jgi:hypothetical protein
VFAGRDINESSTALARSYFVATQILFDTAEHSPYIVRMILRHSQPASPHVVRYRNPIVAVLTDLHFLIPFGVLIIGVVLLVELH